MVKTIHIVVSGRVQGVFFRQSARAEAIKMGIGGWVRNRDDGAVEMMARGSAGALEKFIDWCRRGPEKAEVRSLQWQDAEPADFEGFTVRR